MYKAICRVTGYAYGVRWVGFNKYGTGTSVYTVYRTSVISVHGVHQYKVHISMHDTHRYTPVYIGTGYTSVHIGIHQYTSVQGTSVYTSIHRYRVHISMHDIHRYTPVYRVHITDISMHDIHQYRVYIGMPFTVRHCYTVYGIIGIPWYSMTVTATVYHAMIPMVYVIMCTVPLSNPLGLLEYTA